VDFLIVGNGMFGAATARHLVIKRRLADVCLLGEEVPSLAEEWHRRVEGSLTIIAIQS
jgi:glycine/D-amino acid oxidase-like deaminating enzyme